jgi:hypothetical protein
MRGVAAGANREWGRRYFVILSNSVQCNPFGDMTEFSGIWIVEAVEALDHHFYVAAILCSKSLIVSIDD